MVADRFITSFFSQKYEFSLSAPFSGLQRLQGILPTLNRYCKERNFYGRKILQFILELFQEQNSVFSTYTWINTFMGPMKFFSYDPQKCFLLILRSVFISLLTKYFSSREHFSGQNFTISQNMESCPKLTTEFCSDPLTDWAIRAWVQLAFRHIYIYI